MKVSLLKTYLVAFCRLSLIATLIAFVGVSLWIFVLTGAVSLPAWTSAIWWIVDMILLVYALIHWIFSMIIVWDDKDQMVGPAIGMPIIFLVVSGIGVSLGGPGCGSLFLFLPLLAMAVIDILLLHSGNDQPQKQASEQVMQQQ